MFKSLRYSGIIGKGDGFYYQVVIFLALALKERREHRLTLWASLFWSFLGYFTDLFATFTPYYVFNNFYKYDFG
ncbi:MAG: hypothetical protein ACLUFP_07005 [Streptococcus salivarius]